MCINDCIRTNESLSVGKAFSLQVFNSNGEIESRVASTKRFRYDERATPYLHGVVPSAAAPGDRVQILGSFRWWRLQMETYPPNDPRKLIKSVYIGPFRCVPEILRSTKVVCLP